MNFVAHVEVAARVRPDVAAPAPAPAPLSAVLVGSALPDLAAIGAFRLTPGGATGDLAEGIRVHHRTDDVFHGDARFRELMGGLRGSLLAAGLGRGAARAAGHVGVELLLDGHLLVDRDVADRTDGLLRSVGRPSPQVLDAVPEAVRSSWRVHLGVVAERITPHAYRAADLVAARLQRILARRPRLAFAETDAPVLATELRRIQPDVAAVAHDVVADVAAAVAAAGWSEGRR